MCRKHESRDGFFLWEMVVALSLVFFFSFLIIRAEQHWLSEQKLSDKSANDLFRAVEILEGVASNPSLGAIPSYVLERDLSLLFGKKVELPPCRYTKVKVGSVCLVGLHRDALSRVPRLR